MRSLWIGILLVFISVSGWAQTSTCAQTLRLAVSTYEQGRLNEVPGILEKCLSLGGANGFTKQERVTALRILTLAYIYQEEPEEADKTMLALLNTDHFFEINENVDPAEFTALYKTFRTKPIYSVGGKFGGNGSFPTPTNNFFVGSDAARNGEYSTGYNIQLGGVFEKTLFEKKNPASRWTAAPEIMFLQNKFSYANEELTTNDVNGDPNARLEAEFSQTRLDLNLLLQYKLKDHYLNPYISFGPALSYLLSASGQFQTQFPTIGTAVTGPSIDLKDNFQSIDYALIASAGLKFKFGEVYLTADIRYKYGFTNQIDEEARTNPEAAFDFGAISNDFRQSNLMINLGFIYPYFNPKKLLR